MSRSRSRSCLALLVAMACTPAFATIQSDDPSRQSEASLAASVEVPVAALDALSEGGKFVVTSVAASGAMVAVTVSAVGVGASFVVHLAAESVRALGIVAGTAVSVTVVASGWLLEVGGEALCFIASDPARAHIHSRELGA